ncbi:hypothetical protein [Sulfuricurvum sp.]|uniref:hypothetical protein n=1 Tax=Sulfuricurvum sp. TaxID=2025608 RepID=UPI003BB175D7
MKFGYVVLIFFLSILNHFMIIGYQGIERFDPDIWFVNVTNDLDSTCYRGALANDLSNRLITQDMTKQEVINLLGEPERIGQKDMKYEMDYSLGFCSMADYNSLIIHLDSSERVEDVHTRQH